MLLVSSFGSDEDGEMHPVLRRILLHGGLTAAVLALIGMVFAELAGLWLTGSATRSSTNADEQIGTSLRSRVPLTMALWGFGFVAVCELVIWRVRGNRPPAAQQTEPPQDEAEKLLNELLAQAEAKMALEAESQKTEDGEQKAEDRGQRTEGKEQRTESREQSHG